MMLLKPLEVLAQEPFRLFLPFISQSFYHYGRFWLGNRPFNYRDIWLNVGYSSEEKADMVISEDVGFVSLACSAKDFDKLHQYLDSQQQITVKNDWGAYELSGTGTVQVVEKLEDFTFCHLFVDTDLEVSERG